MYHTERAAKSSEKGEFDGFERQVQVYLSTTTMTFSSQRVRANPYAWPERLQYVTDRAAPDLRCRHDMTNYRRRV